MTNSKPQRLAVCVYKRLKLSRNIEQELFTAAMTTDQSVAVQEKIQAHLTFSESFKNMELEKKSLTERLSQIKYLSEGALAVDPLKSNLAVSLFQSQQNQFQLVINDLDHMRMTLWSYQDNFDELWQTLDLLDDALGQGLTLAYLEPLGYLTSKIEQLGTGLNGEALLHLPSLKQTGFIHALSESMGSIGVQIKPYKDDFYYICNTVTLGRSEIEIVTLLDQVVEKLSEREWAGTETLWASEKSKMMDQVGRAYGQCQYAQMVEEGEALKWLSALMLGERLGILTPNHKATQSLGKWAAYLRAITESELEYTAEKTLSSREKMQKRGELLKSISTQWKWRG